VTPHALLQCIEISGKPQATAALFEKSSLQDALDKTVRKPQFCCASFTECRNSFLL